MAAVAITDRKVVHRQASADPSSQAQNCAGSSPPHFRKAADEVAILRPRSALVRFAEASPRGLSERLSATLAKSPTDECGNARIIGTR
jgi:hypothetical protein